MLTKKYYELIACQLAECAPKEPDSVSEFMRGYVTAHTQIRSRLIDLFSADNPKFDRARFLEACGVAS